MAAMASLYTFFPAFKFSMGISDYPSLVQTVSNLHQMEGCQNHQAYIPLGVAWSH